MDSVRLINVKRFGPYMFKIGPYTYMEVGESKIICVAKRKKKVRRMLKIKRRRV